MFRSNVLVRKPLRLFGSIGKHPLALVAQRKIDRRRNLLPDRGMSLDLLADGLDRGMGAQESVSQRFVFAQKSQKQMLRLNIRRPELAGFIASEKDDAPGFLGITFKHKTLSQVLGKNRSIPPTRTSPGNPWPSLYYAIGVPPNPIPQ